MLIKRKAFAYITRRDHLLIFSHPDSPEAGLQVPAGTLREGETSAEGVLREAREETGLTQLRLVTFLGKVQRDMSDFGRVEVHQRYFYHVWCDEDAPERSIHGEFDPMMIRSDERRSALNFSGWHYLMACHP